MGKDTESIIISGPKFREWLTNSLTEDEDYRPDQIKLQGSTNDNLRHIVPELNEKGMPTDEIMLKKRIRGVMVSVKPYKSKKFASDHPTLVISFLREDAKIPEQLFLSVSSTRRCKQFAKLELKPTEIVYYGHVVELGAERVHGNNGYDWNVVTFKHLRNLTEAELEYTEWLHELYEKYSVQFLAFEDASEEADEYFDIKSEVKAESTRPQIDEDEDEPKPKNKPKVDDEEEESKPKRKAKAEDDEDEPKPKRKAKVEDDEDEEKPAKRSGYPSLEDDEDDDLSKPKAGKKSPEDED